MSDYKIPAQTRIGHVHLKVSDLQKSMAFYCDLLGFELMTTTATRPRLFRRVVTTIILV
jgi:catechol-2,3-dioxygenase